MANDGFNGSTLTFGSSISDILSIGYTSNGSSIQLTGSDAAKKFFATGIPDDGITVTVAGVTSIGAGDDDATTTIAWYDGTTNTLGSHVCISVEISGSEDSPVTSTVELVPSV